jgi:hypothetical protein
MTAELLLLNALQMYECNNKDMALAIGDKSKTIWTTTPAISAKRRLRTTITIFILPLIWNP